MKMLHVVGDSGFGGGSRVILAIAAGARDAGHDVTVLTTDPRFEAILADAGITVLAEDWVRRRPHPWHDLRGVTALQRHLQHERYDVVHTHTTRGGVLGRLSAHRAGTPTVLHTAHGFAVAEHDAAWKQAAVFAVERVAAGWCDHIVTVSHHHARWATARGVRPHGSLRVIPNGVPDVFATTSDRSRSRRGPTLVHVGRLAHGKGIDVLLEAVAILRRTAGSSAGVHLVVAGDGPASAELHALADHLGVTTAVTWLGHRDDVGAVLAAADVVVLPSLREGLSLALLEAMAAGRPIVATNLGGTAEALAGGRGGVLVPPGDVVAVARAVGRLLDEPTRADAMGRRARELYEADYRLERMVSDYVALYAEVAAAGPGSGRGPVATPVNAAR